MEMSKPVQELFEILATKAYKMPVGQVHNILERYQNRIDGLEKAETVVMALLDLMEFDSNGNLKNKELAEKIKEADNSVIQVLQMALNIHAHYACSPFTPKDYLKKLTEKHSSIKSKDQIESYRDSLTFILREE